MKRVSAGGLKNGFRFYTQLDAYTHVSGVGGKVGSVHDPPNSHGLSLRGICHLNEHIVGTYSRDDELKFEKYGCGPEEKVNIRVNHTSTFFGHGHLLKREQMLELFDIIARGVRHPTIDQAAVDREGAAVLNEYYLHGIDLMEDLLSAAIHQAMYEKNPAKNRIDCEPEDLARIEVKDIQKFFKAYFVPNNMFAVLLGPSFHKAREIAEKYFGDLEPRTVPPLNYDYSETRPALVTPKLIEIERKGIHQYHVAVGFPTNPYGDKDDEVLDVLSYILRWRMRESLRAQNTELGKGTYRAKKFTSRSSVHGMIYAAFATPSKDFAFWGLEKILEICNDLKNKWVLNDELEAMSGKLYNGYVEDFTIAPDELSERIIEAAANGDEDMRRLNSFLGRLSRVGKKSIMRVANEYFTTPNYVAVIIKPVMQ
ncbi:MAG: insulinase family protein [Candidatus Sungbacteria bacterium]|nr:insulinase family protein [Candidatus Sungbacteria bacterium]